MPIYEYRCDNCGKVFEEWQKFSDPPVDRCSDCGGNAHRLISQTSFVLKGSGWYVTDYARKDGSSSPKPSTESKPSSASSE